MWVVSQDRKTILEAVRFERFGHIIEITGRGGYCHKTEYNNEEEANRVMNRIYGILRVGENTLALPIKEEENAES